MEALGPPFVVFRERVLDELKVSDDQREKLMELAMEQVMQTGPFLDALPSSGPEREKKLAEHRKNAAEKLAKNLNEVLQPGQRNRLRQVTLQQEGGFALGREDVRKELNVTEDQLKQFMAISQGLQRRSRPWSSRCKRAVTRRRFGRKSSNCARTTPGSSKPSSPTARKSSGKRCSARRSSWVIDRGVFSPRIPRG